MQTSNMAQPHKPSETRTSIVTQAYLDTTFLSIFSSW